VSENSIVSVEREARSIARLTFRGGRKVLSQKEQHIVNSAELIRQRWNVSPKKWQAKHVRWILEVGLADRSAGTRYRYYRFLRQILKRMDKWDGVEPFLNGSWQNP
jgi:hypothetical protein